MKLITTMLADEVYEAVNENNNKVLMDMREDEVRKAQNPVELLLSALAACGAVDIVSMLRKRRKSIQHFEITTEGTRQDTAPRYFTRIHVHYIVTSSDVQTEELQKAAGLALEKYCTVATSLKSQITYSVEVKR